MLRNVIKGKMLKNLKKCLKKNIKNIKKFKILIVMDGQSNLKEF